MANNDDVEIVKTLYRDGTLLLPHRRYNLLIEDFRNIESLHQIVWLRRIGCFLLSLIILMMPLRFLLSSVDLRNDFH